MEKVNIYSRYNKDERSFAIKIVGKHMTKQEAKNDVDINTIMKKYQKYGAIPQSNGRSARFADVSEIGDYHESLNKIHLADSLFSQLPSAVRLRFGNDPAQLIQFLNNPENAEEASKLGLIDIPMEKGQKIPETTSEGVTEDVKDKSE